MPCYDGREDSCSSRETCDCEPFKTDARLATRAACDMRTILRRAGLETLLTVDTRRWIAAHDLEDKLRIREENENGIRDKTRQRALNKLNLDERRVLGL